MAGYFYPRSLLRPFPTVAPVILLRDSLISAVFLPPLPSSLAVHGTGCHLPLPLEPHIATHCLLSKQSSTAPSGAPLLPSHFFRAPSRPSPSPHSRDCSVPRLWRGSRDLRRWCWRVLLLWRLPWERPLCRRCTSTALPPSVKCHPSRLWCIKFPWVLGAKGLSIRLSYTCEASQRCASSSAHLQICSSSSDSMRNRSSPQVSSTRTGVHPPEYSIAPFFVPGVVPPLTKTHSE